jgi:hypothetical protein
VLKVAALQDANAIDKNANIAKRMPRRRAPQAPRLPTSTNSSANLFCWICSGLESLTAMTAIKPPF